MHRGIFSIKCSSLICITFLCLLFYDSQGCGFMTVRDVALCSQECGFMTVRDVASRQSLTWLYDSQGCGFMTVTDVVV